jgi:hypothetical protein
VTLAPALDGILRFNLWPVIGARLVPTVMIWLLDPVRIVNAVGAELRGAS